MTNIPRQRAVKHLCHATGCKVEIPPALFMCKPHWFGLPKAMRDAVWREYRPGQERTKTPSREYLEVARAAIRYLEERETAAR